MADQDLAPWANQLPQGPQPAPDDNSLAPWVADADKPVSAPKAAPQRRSAPAPVSRPSASPAPTGPEPTWGQVAQQATQNLIPSAEGAGQAMWNAIVHPVQTVKNVAQLGEGVASQAAGALGFQQDPQQKAQTEALANAVERHYAQTYGSVRGLKQALSTDPVSVAMDASALLSGGAGAAEKVAGLEKVAGAVGKVASAIDPVANAVRVAKVATVPVRAVVRGASSVATGVPADLMKVAAQAGATSDPALKGAFLKFYTGQGDPAEYLQTAQSALSKLRDDASSDYLATKGDLINAQPSFQPVDDAIAAARNETMRGGVNVGQFKAANDAIDQAEQMVNGWKTAPDSAYRSLLGFDNLKQAIWDLRDSTGNAAAQKHLGAIYNGVKSAIVDTDPAYANLMEQYQAARNAITDTQKTLVGAGKNPSATTAMAKSLRALKTATGKNLLGDLAAKEPTLPYMLAGNALNPWGAGGKAGFFEGMSALPLATTAGMIAHNPVVGLGSLGVQLVGQSPRIAGALNYAGGVAEGVLAPTATGSYYAGRLGDMGEADDAPALAPVTSPRIETTWQNILQRESGNRQWDAEGNVIVSPKGAIGAAQIMPGTGPTAAKLAGLPWDPQRLKTDEAYNRALGKAYFLALVQQYGGDVAKAAAAYNAGPGNVDRALNTASAEDGWIGNLPAETQAYVPAVTRGHYAKGGKVDGARVETLTRKLMDEAEKAKKAETKSTKPLLNVPDEAVIKALAVAKNAV